MLTGLIHLALALRSDGRYPLPANAKVTVGGRTNTSQREADKPFCSSFKVSKEEVKEHFAHYHEVSGAELHDYYVQLDCGVSGSLFVNGKKFFGLLSRATYSKQIILMGKFAGWAGNTLLIQI